MMNTLKLKSTFLISLCMLMCTLILPVTVQKADAQSISDATPYTLGSEQNGVITENGDEKQYYKFTLSESGAIQLKITAHMKWCYMKLYTSEAEELWNDNPNWNSTSEVNFVDEKFYLTSGTYYFCIEKDGSHCGNFNFKIDFTSSNETFCEENGGSNNTISDANTISVNGSLYKAQLATNDNKDFYKFSIPSSGEIFLTSTFYDMEWVYWKLYNENGEELVSSNPSWNSTTKNILVNESMNLISGNYYLSISDDNGRYGKYNFALSFTPSNETYNESNTSCNNTLDTASALTPGNTYKGQLAINDAKDFYKFNIPASQTLSVSLNGSLEYIYVKLYDSQGNELWSENPRWNDTTKEINLKRLTILEKGSYYLSVSKDGSRTGNYELNISKLTQSNCPHNNYETEWHDATYFSKGYRIYKCKDCGYTYKADYVPVLKLPKGNWNYFNNCTAGNGKLYLYWSTYSDATGYQIRYCKSKSFKSGVVTKTIKGSSKYYTTITRLRRKQVYYVQVRPYKRSGKKVAYGEWSSKKKLKTR